MLLPSTRDIRKANFYMFYMMLQSSFIPGIAPPTLGIPSASNSKSGANSFTMSAGG